MKGERPVTSKEELQGPRHSIIRPAVAEGCAALWSQRSTIPLFYSIEKESSPFEAPPSKPYKPWVVFHKPWNNQK